MNLRLKYLLVFTLVWSVFSFSLQASIIHFCKENKMIKNQDSSNPFSEEESPDDSDEETDEETDEELLYLENSSFYLISQKNSHNSWNPLALRVQTYFVRIPVPPPRF